MKTAYLEIMLIDDVVLSAHSATVGAHESLSHIPGATLLGVAASKLYRTLTSDDAFAVFHSGKVRFSSGLPMHGEMRAAPMPLAFHLVKTAKPIDEVDDKLASVDVYNLAAGKMPSNLQLKAMRKDFVDAVGNRVAPTKTYRMKTAISAEKQRAAEGQLFGYEALAAGQRYGAFITADESIDASLFSRITKSLCGEARLGRSRSAEYGRVRISDRQAFATFPIETGTSKLVLLAMSDLALVDDAGQPTVTPSGAALGLYGGQVDFSRSFISSRNYAPYNAKRRAHDMECHVIAQGSVITLTGTFAADDIASLGNGVGIHREAGLGEVLVNPALLSKYRLTIADVKPEKSESQQVEATQDGAAFIAWLRRRDVGASAEMAAAFDLAKSWRKELVSHKASARRYLGLLPHEPVGPSVSQWGAVHHAGKRANDFTALLTTLRATINKDAKGWGEQFTKGKELTNFCTWFLVEAGKLGDARPQTAESNQRHIAAIREFAQLAMDDARKSRSSSQTQQLEQS